MSTGGTSTWKRVRGSKNLALVVGSIAIFADVFIYSVVVPITPHALLHHVGVNPTEVQFYTSVFLAAYGSALVVCCPALGWLLDRDVRRRLPFLLGILILTISTSLLCVGNSIAVLIAGRVLSGVSSSIVWVAGMALVIERFHGSDFGLVYGVLGVSENTATYVEPVVGGVVLAKRGWYAVFAIVFAFLLLDTIGRLLLNDADTAIRLVEERSPIPQSREHDPEALPGVPKEATAPTDAYRGSIEERPEAAKLKQDVHGSTDPRKTEAMVTTRSIDPLTIFNDPGLDAPSILERRISHDPDRSRNTPSPLKRCLAASWAVFTQSWMQAALNALIPLHVMGTFNWSSEDVGLVFLPMMSATVSAPVVGRCSDRHGPRCYAVAGHLLVGAASISLRLVAHDTRTCKILLYVLSAILGLGMCLILVPMTAELSEAFIELFDVDMAGGKRPQRAIARTCALVTTVWAAGSIVGPYLGSSMKDHTSWATTVTVIGTGGMISAIPVSLWTCTLRTGARDEADERQSSVGTVSR